MLEMEELANNLEFDSSDLEILLELFLESTQVHLANIEDALDTNNFLTISSEAHAIKSSATNLLLKEIVYISDRLECAAKNNQRLNIISIYKKLEQTIEELHFSCYESI